MSEPGSVNTDREARLRDMLQAKREDLVRTLERQLGEQLGEDVLASLDETIEIGDRSVLVHGRDVELGILQLKREELRQIEAALGRLRAGEYGRCEECETEIDEKRLEILPFATLCVECKRRREADQRRVEATGRGFRSGFRDIREARSEDDED